MTVHEPTLHTEFRLQCAVRAARSYADAHALARGEQNPITLDHERRACASGDMFLRQAQDKVTIEELPVGATVDDGAPIWSYVFMGVIFALGMVAGGILF